MNEKLILNIENYLTYPKFLEKRGISCTGYIYDIRKMSQQSLEYRQQDVITDINIYYDDAVTATNIMKLARKEFDELGISYATLGNEDLADKRNKMVNSFTNFITAKTHLQRIIYMIPDLVIFIHNTKEIKEHEKKCKKLYNEMENVFRKIKFDSIFELNSIYRHILKEETVH